MEWKWVSNSWDDDHFPTFYGKSCYSHVPVTTSDKLTWLSAPHWWTGFNWAHLSSRNSTSGLRIQMLLQNGQFRLTRDIPWSSQETWVGWIIQSAENHNPSCICYYTILSMVNLWLIIGNIIWLVVWNMIYDSTNLSIVLDDLCEENHSGNTSSLRPSCSRFLMICKSM